MLILFMLVSSYIFMMQYAYSKLLGSSEEAVKLLHEQTLELQEIRNQIAELQPGHTLTRDYSDSNTIQRQGV